MPAVRSSPISPVDIRGRHQGHRRSHRALGTAKPWFHRSGRCAARYAHQSYFCGFVHVIGSSDGPSEPMHAPDASTGSGSGSRRNDQPADPREVRLSRMAACRKRGARRRLAPGAGWRPAQADARRPPSATAVRGRSPTKRAICRQAPLRPVRRCRLTGTRAQSWATAASTGARRKNGRFSRREARSW